MIDLQDARERMVDRQLSRRGVHDEGVLEAMRIVPREVFVPEGMEEFAYDDAPLPITSGQTISQPYIVGLMIQAAGIRPGDRVLEIGAGSGYAAAVVSRIAAQVYTIERHAALTEATAARLASLGYVYIALRTGDGTRGWSEAAPFDAVLVAAGGPAVPQSLKEQLDIGGRLVTPVGETHEVQRLIRVTRRDAAPFEEEDLGGVRFVPLIGEFGWAENAPESRPAEARPFAPPPMAIPRMIAAAAEPLPDLDDPTFGALFDRFAHAAWCCWAKRATGPRNSTAPAPPSPVA